MTTDDGMTITETPSATIARQAAEIERLRSELDRTERIASLTAAASSVAGEALRKMDEANAEIERLRQEKADILAAKEIVFAPPAIPEGFVIDQLRKTIISLYADIARIREEGQKDYEGMREFQRKFIDADHEIERLREGERAADAEIERLRGDLAAMSDSVAVAAQALNDEERENERLREWQRQMVEKAADQSLDGYRELGAKLAEKDAEIERLRDQLAAMERGYKSFRDTAKVEFTRLRGLLRDYLRAASDERVSYDEFQDGLRTWEDRVREALGE